ncbi:MAG TPA: hypothetical protein VMT31_07310 [Methanomicrobiales archaeon]|jgi:hypothetical protein|nr:hypothetical protein [Methanomicrobiales archaeon]
MIRDSLREALARMADTPVLWITGLYLGALFALDLLIPAAGDTTLGARIGFLGLCALPFFLGGTYGVIRADGAGLRGYLESGARYYFTILLAAAVIVAAGFVTVLLLLVPFTLLGGTPLEFLPVAVLGVGIPFAFFTFFSDTAAVFEDRKVLDSIRRSVEFVLGRPGRALSFYLVNLAVGLLGLFFAVFLWSFIIADRIQPFMEANQTALFHNMTAPDLVNLIGVPGLEAGAAIGFAAVALGATLLLTFKACYFRRAVSAAPSAPAAGEFDEKGRWYRY